VSNISLDRPVGLRERTKAKRRAAIIRAALGLFTERGYDSTSVAAIAEAAEVAPRTVARYFPAKIDMALALTNDIAARLIAVFADSQLGFVDGIDRWLLDEERGLDPEIAALSAAMFDANPQLRAVSSAHVAEAASIGNRALLAEMALPSTDPMASVVVAAVGAAIGEYISMIGKEQITSEVHQAFVEFLRSLITSRRTR
jgi:AcrR family transcriptional regulator